jgi:hypothetical protein
MKAAGRAMAAVAAGAVVLAAASWWAAAPTAPPQDADRPAASGQPLVAAEPCRQVLNCAAAQAMQAASEACRPAIEQLAVFAPRWTQGAAQPIFTEYAWLDRQRGTITYFGNRAEFQDAGGGFAAVAYECDFDPVARSALDARVRGAAKS